MKNRQGRRSIIFISLLFCVCIVFLFTYFKLRANIEEMQKEADSILQEYTQISEDNERMRKYIDEADEAKIVEHYARTYWDYVFPEERVYYDITPGS